MSLTWMTKAGMCLLISANALSNFDFHFLSNSTSSFLENNDEIEVLLSTIISEPENGKVHQFILMTNTLGEIQRLKRVSGDEEQVIALQEVVEGEAVLARAEGRDAVLISCPECTQTSGGAVSIKFLNNGITDYYKTLTVELVRDETSWHLETRNEEVIYSMKLIQRTIFGRVIGIDRIELTL